MGAPSPSRFLAEHLIRFRPAGVDLNGSDFQATRVQSLSLHGTAITLSPTERVHARMRGELSGMFTVITCRTVAQAMRRLAERDDYQAVIVDLNACGTAAERLLKVVAECEPLARCVLIYDDEASGAEAWRYLADGLADACVGLGWSAGALRALAIDTGAGAPPKGLDFGDEPTEPNQRKDRAD